MMSFIKPVLPILPNEIWRLIMLAGPAVYRVLVLVCRSFRVDIDSAKSAMVRCRFTLLSIEYILPCGLLHRADDKPAIIYSNGSQYWYVDGKLHRDVGPAVIYADASRIIKGDLCEWWTHGVRVR